MILPEMGEREVNAVFTTGIYGRAGCTGRSKPSNRAAYPSAVAAQAAGKTVLATRIRGLEDAVCDGETGLLVEAGNAQALAEGMRVLLEDGEGRRRLGLAAREWARRFDWDRLARDQEEVYFRAIEAIYH